jgi:hypothetical protein
VDSRLSFSFKCFRAPGFASKPLIPKRTSVPRDNLPRDACCRLGALITMISSQQRFWQPLPPACPTSAFTVSTVLRSNREKAFQNFLIGFWRSSRVRTVHMLAFTRMEGLPLDILGSCINILLFAEVTQHQSFQMLSMISESNLGQVQRGPSLGWKRYRESGVDSVEGRSGLLVSQICSSW